MNKIVKVKIFSCYKKTYTPLINKIIKLIYNDQNVNYCLEVLDISDNGKRNIQSQRSLTQYITRTVMVYENNVLVHIVGMSNTNYDLDKKFEFDNGKSIKTVDAYGKNDYHANTYLKQGINRIFQLYFDNKNTADLSFYLLDTDKNVNYPNNLYNTLSYRELETIGFKILNINEIDFTEYEDTCRSQVNANNLSFPSFSKYIKDIAYISKKNTGNTPSFLVCDELQTINEDGTYTYSTERYKYTFKALSAQGYDNLIRMWCMKVLADEEKTDIEFILGKQYFAYDQVEKRISDKLTGPIISLFKEAGIKIEYLTNEEFMDEVIKADSVYERYKLNNELRNQTLFRNNIRKKGIPVECAVCGEDNPVLLDAAHIWEVNAIKSASTQTINNFIRINELEELLNNESSHHSEIFFKKYSLVNSGENGIWLCKNHHKLFDENYYCFDSEDGKILLHFEDAADALEFANQIEYEKLDNKVLTKATKAFLAQRQLVFTI
jgi:hypothetical protein